jgi:hypothetical protein
MVKIINSNKMSTFKDITYKKNDDETWTEWTKRVPDNDEDKLDYIGETIYVKIHENDKKNAGKISDLLLGLGIEDLIPLLESEELLDKKIKEAYEAVRDFEEYKMSEKEEDEEEVWTVKQVNTITVAKMIEALIKLPPDAKLVMTENMNCDDNEFGEVMLPEPYIVGTRKTGYKPNIPDGTKVYRIGHSNNQQY